ncbi:MAG TPA: hypothetical protein DCP68_07305 [Ruminococcus sp.]|nr:hypothetical protein [Ruminococcus sp.]
MGDRLRKYTKQLLELAFRAGLPALIIFSVLLGTFIVKGTPQNAEFTPRIYLRILIVCYITAFITTCVVHFRDLVHAAMRADEHLIGKNFSGFRKADKLFSTGLDLYAHDHAREALDTFLQLKKEYELTESEDGVLSFYTGRCYQLLGCASNAVPYYRRARQNGFSAPFAMLFEARSCAEGGDFEGSLKLYDYLLSHDRPDTFFFLYTDIGYIYIRQNQPDQAIEWFERSIREQQNYAFALSGMAIAMLQKGEFETAHDYYYKALINRLKEPASFRSYFAETKQLMLQNHPDWSKKTGIHPEEAAPEQDAPADAQTDKTDAPQNDEAKASAAEN